MNADASPDNPSGKRVNLPGWARWIFRVLRVFWLTELALLIVVVYGLLTGWSTPRQWSDGLFLGAAAQLAVAGLMIISTQGESLDAATMRYVNRGDPSETRKLLIGEAVRKRMFSVKAFLGGILTLLIALLMLRV